ncbi:MAG TPA: hypothetical protein V6D12_17780 [Candidatus Obscuribacterales bacterium]
MFGWARSHFSTYIPGIFGRVVAGVASDKSSLFVSPGTFKTATVVNDT